MEDNEPRAQEATKTTFKARPVMGVGLRLVISVVLVLAGLFSLISAVVIAITMVTLIMPFLYGFVSVPFLSLATFAAFLVSFVAFGVVGTLALKFAYYLLRNRDIARREIVIFAVCLVLALGLAYGVVPVLQGMLPV